MVVEHKHKIGFNGIILIEPKPQEIFPSLGCLSRLIFNEPNKEKYQIKALIYEKYQNKMQLKAKSQNNSQIKRLA